MSTRPNLLQILGEVPGDAVTTYLLDIMNNGLGLADRLTAARELFFRHHAAVGAAMIREWQQYPKQRPPIKNGDRFDRDHNRKAEDIMELLVKVGSEDTLRALSEDLPQVPALLRTTLIASLQFRDEQFGYFLNVKTTPLSLEAARIAEKLLAQLLEDAADSGTDVSDDPMTRVCDHAAALAELWPPDYTFDLDAPLDKRNFQLAVVKNVWRGKQGLPALPLPELKPVQRLPEATTKAALAKVIAATSAAGREAALKELESLGLPALPAVLETLAALPEQHASREPLQRLAQRLANVVSDVQLAGELSTVDDEFRERVDALRNRPLTSKSFVALLTTRPLPRKTAGIKVLAERAAAYYGIQLTVILVKPQSRLGIDESRWTMRCHMKADGKEFRPYPSSSSTKEPSDADFAQMGKTLVSPPQAPLSIGVSVSRIDGY